MASTTLPFTKDTQRNKEELTEDDNSNLSALLTNSSAHTLMEQHNGLENATHDPDEEPASKKTELFLGQPSFSSLIDADGQSRARSSTQRRADEGPEQAKERLEKMRCAVRTLLECVGEDPDREGLLGTPSRYAKALLFFTKGYELNVESIANNALFHEGHHEMVVVKDIEINSMCEHHLVPFIGKVFFIQIHHPSVDPS